jgi:cytoskeletal protein CcmA (bactofilin family)
MATFAATAALLLSVSTPAVAATIESDLILIRSDDVVEEDLYAVANRIQIDGTVEGDLTAAAFEEIRIDGSIEGSVTAVSSRIVIAGTVTGSVRALAPEVVVEGTVGGDVVTATGAFTEADGAAIGRDVLLAAWRMNVRGAVGRDLQGVVRSGLLDGHVVRNVEMSIRSLDVGGRTVVEGDLGYRSERDATVDPEATIGGSLLARRPLNPNVRVSGLGIMLRVLSVLFGAGLGLAVVWAAATRAEYAGLALRTRPVAVAGWGLAAFATPLALVGLVAALVAFTPPQAALPLVAVAIPVLFGVLGILGFAVLVSPVPVALMMGGRLAPRRSPFARFLVGFVLVAALGLLPYVGSWFLVPIMVIGVGGWLTPPGDQPLEQGRHVGER